MLGNKVQELTTHRATSNSIQAMQERKGLSFEHVTIAGKLEDITFKAPMGAIIGVAGLADSGHLTVLEAIAGIVRPQSGSIQLPDGKMVRTTQRGAVQQGVALISGDRRRVGLMLDKPLWENIAQVRALALAREGYFLWNNRLRERASAYIPQLGIKAVSVNQQVGRLSGGNQQKVVFAKWLEAEPSVLLLDDPTRGIDVGAKAEIYALMRNLADKGAVQILSSTDPKELAAVCDWVFVFYNGRLCATLEPPQLDAHTILEVMNTGRQLAQAG